MRKPRIAVALSLAGWLTSLVATGEDRQPITTAHLSKPAPLKLITPSNEIEPWRAGLLDIHHISTGRGDAAFFVFPDGTTLLFDAGDLNAEEFQQRNAPLRVAPQRPSDERTPGEWIAAYIERASPPEREPAIDYALVSHFDADHYGDIAASKGDSPQGPYKQTGITAVADLVPIGTLIDRGYPDYDFPLPLATYHPPGSTFANYLAFVRSQTDNGRIQAAALEVGSDHQITLLRDPERYPTFRVRNIKANAVVCTPDGKGRERLFAPDDLIDRGGRFAENPLSLAIRVSYGEFDYFTGGDMTGLSGFGLADWFDVETPAAGAVGPVEAMALNHHGNRDATNGMFLGTLRPRTVVQQSWCSDHPGQEVLHRLVSQHHYKGPRDIFATCVQPETQVTLGPWLTRNYASLNGHVVIRVDRGGHEYRVYVLDDSRPGMFVLSVHGPFECHKAHLPGS